MPVDENLGFAGNVNAGLKSIDDDIVLISNDDIVVLTPGWDDLVKEHFKDESVAAVGATSNYVLSHQLYDTKGPEIEFVSCLSFFWIAVSRRAIDRVGLLDESFGLGLCEDLDWCVRAKQCGFRLILDRRLRVHHWGSQTFRCMGVDTQALDLKNRALLKEKHSL